MRFRMMSEWGFQNELIENLISEKFDNFKKMDFSLDYNKFCNIN